MSRLCSPCVTAGAIRPRPRSATRGWPPGGASLICCFSGLSRPIPARAEPLRVLAFGDSLTAGYMLPANAAFPAQLERRLRADGFDATVINAGVSGETTAAGLARADFALGEGADLGDSGAWRQ